MNAECARGTRRAAVGILLLGAVAGLAGCGGGRTKEPGAGGGGTAGGPAAARRPAGKRLRIALLPKVKGISYFTSCKRGAEEAAQELGNVELIYDGPTDGDPRRQAELIEQWVVDGVDAICISPNAPGVVAGALREARAAGIKVLTWDADGAADTREFFVNQATAAAIAEGLVRTMLADLGPDAAGDVVIISSDATSANQNSWIDVMKPALAATKLKLATIKYPGENAAAALADATDVIGKYPNLKGIFGISSVSFPAEAEAVEQAGAKGRILVTGLSTPNDMRKFVQSGTVRSVVLWNTVDLGYLTVRAAAAAVEGSLRPGAESFSAGRLGTVKLSGDDILLGDILVFTKENIEKFDF